MAFRASTRSLGFRARRSPASLKSSNREDEIAKLEEQIRRLREESPEEESITTEISKEEKKIVVDEALLEDVKSKDMLLSERDLIDAQLMDTESEGGMGSLPTILAVVGAAVFLFFFAQVPVGQEDLSRYSASGSGTVTSIDLGDLNPDRDARTRP